MVTRWKTDAANQPTQNQNHLPIGDDRARRRKRPPAYLIDAALEHADRGAWATIEGQVLARFAGVEQLPTGAAVDHLRAVGGNLRIWIVARPLVVDRQVHPGRAFYELHPGHRGPVVFGLGPALGLVHFGSVDGERRARSQYGDLHFGQTLGAAFADFMGTQA